MDRIILKHDVTVMPQQKNMELNMSFTMYGFLAHSSNDII